ncbi:MAG: 7-carboxy-7-deazaguanine synthase QueE [Bacteriovoracaceae bacterium]|nr:7-carboxy-7-deazaguanine synthase QueE [Bacteriovoracaceae bacterium]
MDNFPINSIYLATEGEGIYLGTVQVFLRFQGCAVACKNCDSKETWDFSGGESFTLERVIDAIYTNGNNGKIKRVSITGGDPLHSRNLNPVLTCIAALKKNDYYINLEASGLSVVDEIFSKIDFISFDFKTPSTGVTSDHDLIVELAHKYPYKFQIKAVIEDEMDFQVTFDAYSKVKRALKIDTLNFPWCLTPVYNLKEAFPVERFKRVIKWNQDVGGPFRVIGQQHKWIYGPDERRV